MAITRKEFLKLTLAVAGGAFVAGCGSGTDPMMMNSADCVANGTNVSIGANHGHTLVVSKADVTAAADKTYDITGSAGHSHSVTVTAANFASLKSNRAISVTSTNSSGHTHTVSVSCA